MKTTEIKTFCFLGHNLLPTTSHHASMHLPCVFLNSGAHREVKLEGEGATEKGELSRMGEGKGSEMK